MPKSHALASSVKLCDMESSGFVLVRLSTRSPQVRQTKSGIRTRLRLMSFQSLVSSDPRSSSIISCPYEERSVETARVPTAPIAIFRKKLESGLSNSLGISLVLATSAQPWPELVVNVDY